MILLDFPNLIEIAYLLNYFILYGEIFILIITYLSVIIKTMGKPRKYALIKLIGLMIIIVGAIVESKTFQMNGSFQPVFTPILISFGATIIGYIQILID